MEVVVRRWWINQKMCKLSSTGKLKWSVLELNSRVSPVHFTLHTHPDMPDIHLYCNMRCYGRHSTHWAILQFSHVLIRSL